MTRAQVLLPALLALALAAAAVPMAADYASKERGLTADNGYQMGDIDHVNLFNGNLSITVPVGLKDSGIPFDHFQKFAQAKKKCFQLSQQAKDNSFQCRTLSGASGSGP